MMFACEGPTFKTELLHPLKPKLTFTFVPALDDVEDFGGPRFSMQSRRPLYETIIASSYDHTWGCRPKKVFQKYTNLYIF